jgi:DNA-binding CsgD family transcriptional regulator
MEKNQTELGTHLIVDPLPATPPPHALLSRAEKEVMDMRIESMSFAQIATARGCAQSTVGALASTACKKLGLKGSCYSQIVNRAMYGVQPPVEKPLNDERVLTMEDF